ncbi:MAG: transketolase [Candidatus Latescibacteria bacterium]|nr:transketolase [Candidatus Latescibacterota bacterium]
MPAQTTPKNNWGLGTDNQLTLKSLHYRRQLLQYIKKAGAGHTGGSLSCVDLLNVLYNRVLRVSPETFTDPHRDRYVQSKGHSIEALYVVLADQGFFPLEDLETLGAYRSHFVGHPTRKVAGIEQNTGALGHGLPICVGMALGGKMDDASYRVFTLLGDGELAEGSNWEAAMSASHFGLDNLVAIIDRNRLQITGPTREVCDNEPLAEKFIAFGWAVRQQDGHDLPGLEARLQDIPFEAGKPSLLIADTIKGKGVSFMENVGRWHHGVPNPGEYAAALEELDGVLALLEANAQ